MSSAPRSNKIAEKIAFKILGKPANMGQESFRKEPNSTKQASKRKKASSKEA